MLLFREEVDSASPSALPIGRKPLVCVLGVPTHMTYADFCQFCGSLIQHILEMRIVRTEGTEDRYSILITFDGQDSTDNFYKHFNGTRFYSLEAEVCRVLFTVHVQYTGSFEHARASPASSTKQRSCPVCLERLDQDNSGILTTICNHSFHCSCISNWTDSSCPVCQYIKQQRQKLIPLTCQNPGNCSIHYFDGCGRDKEGHAIRHREETEHCYSLESKAKLTWHSVRRLIQFKTEMKLVALKYHCLHVTDGCGSCDPADCGFTDALFNSKVEAIVNEHNESRLLTTQLENEKLHYESLLKKAQDETETEISSAVEKAVTLKLQKMQAKLNRCLQEKKFLDDVNENLLKNQEIWKQKIIKIEEREKKALALKDDKIKDLEEQLRDLMVHLEAGKTMEQLSVSNDGTVVPLPIESSSSRNSSKGGSTGSSKVKLRKGGSTGSSKVKLKFGG